MLKTKRHQETRRKKPRDTETRTKKRGDTTIKSIDSLSCRGF